MDERVCFFFTIRGYFNQKREIHNELMKRRELSDQVLKIKLRKRISIAASTFYLWLKDENPDELDLVWCYSLYLAIKIFTSKSRIVFVLNAFLNTMDLVTDETYESKVSSMWKLLIEKEQVYLPIIVSSIQKYGRPNYWEKMHDFSDKEYLVPWIYISLVHGRFDIPMSDFYKMAMYIKNFETKGGAGMEKTSVCNWIRWNRAMMEMDYNENCETMLRWVHAMELERWQLLCPVYFPKTRVKLEKMFQMCKTLYSD